MPQQASMAFPLSGVLLDPFSRLKGNSLVIQAGRLCHQLRSINDDV